MEGNLTKGPILKTLTKLAVPIMASAFLGTLYNITDMAWIGLLGSRAVAGVGVGGMFTRQMVGFFQLADTETYAAAMSYTRIACGLIVFSFLTLTLTGIYTAQGDSKTPFLANLVGLVTNMILDPVLILGPGIFSKAWGYRSCDCHSDRTGDCYEYYDIGDYSAEERKCTKRNKTICKTSTGICEWNL